MGQISTHGVTGSAALAKAAVGNMAAIIKAAKSNVKILFFTVNILSIIIFCPL